MKRILDTLGGAVAPLKSSGRRAKKLIASVALAATTLTAQAQQTPDAAASAAVAAIAAEATEAAVISPLQSYGILAPEGATLAGKAVSAGDQIPLFTYQRVGSGHYIVNMSEWHRFSIKDDTGSALKIKNFIDFVESIIEDDPEMLKEKRVWISGSVGAQSKVNIEWPDKFTIGGKKVITESNDTLRDADDVLTIGNQWRFRQGEDGEKREEYEYTKSGLLNAFGGKQPVIQMIDAHPVRTFGVLGGTVGLGLLAGIGIGRRGRKGEQAELLQTQEGLKTADEDLTRIKQELTTVRGELENAKTTGEGGKQKIAELSVRAAELLLEKGVLIIKTGRGSDDLNELEYLLRNANESTKNDIQTRVSSMYGRLRYCLDFLSPGSQGVSYEDQSGAPLSDVQIILRKEGIQIIVGGDTYFLRNIYAYERGYKDGTIKLTGENGEYVMQAKVDKTTRYITYVLVTSADSTLSVDPEGYKDGIDIRQVDYMLSRIKELLDAIQTNTTDEETIKKKWEEIFSSLFYAEPGLRALCLDRMKESLGSYETNVKIRASKILSEANTHPGRPGSDVLFAAITEILGGTLSLATHEVGVALPSAASEPSSLNVGGGDVLNLELPLIRQMGLAEEFREIGDPEGCKDLINEILSNLEKLPETSRLSMLNQISLYWQSPLGGTSKTAFLEFLESLPEMKTAHPYVYDQFYNAVSASVLIGVASPPVSETIGDNQLFTLIEDEVSISPQMTITIVNIGRVFSESGLTGELQFKIYNDGIQQNSGFRVLRCNIGTNPVQIVVNTEGQVQISIDDVFTPSESYNDFVSVEGVLRSLSV